MKTYKTFNSPKRFWFELGWFDGQDISLLDLQLFHAWDGGGAFLEIQILKFMIGFGWLDQ